MKKNSLYLWIGRKILFKVDKIKSLKDLMPSHELITQHLLTRKKLLVSKGISFTPLEWKISEENFDKIILELNKKVAFKISVKELMIVSDTHSPIIVKIIVDGNPK